MTRTPSAWMVLKFGGTSVSSLPNWTNIARVVAERRAGGARVLIVHSALAGITDRLERLLDAAIAQVPEAEPSRSAIADSQMSSASRSMRNSGGSSRSCVRSPPVWRWCAR